MTKKERKMITKKNEQTIEKGFKMDEIDHQFLKLFYLFELIIITHTFHKNKVIFAIRNQVFCDLSLKVKITSLYIYFTTDNI